MNEELYDLYIKCFPQYPVNNDVFNSLLDQKESHIIYKKDGDKTIGFAVLNGNSISLLCVSEEYRRQGIGGGLLNLSEKYIADSGADKILLGRGGGYILQGVPDDGGDTVSFFAKRGYKAGWTSVNMCISLRNFNADKIDIPPCPGDISFRYIKRSETAALLEAVKDAEPEWADYFIDGGDTVLAAVSGREILGFEILSPDGGRFNLSSSKIGSIGCVGVVKKARDKGIGRQMVLKGIELLREQGCTSIELLYVYLVDWYKKLGFEIVSRQWMGEKVLMNH